MSLELLSMENVQLQDALEGLKQYPRSVFRSLAKATTPNDVDSYSQSTGQDRWKISRGPLFDLVIFGLKSLAHLTSDPSRSKAFFHPRSWSNQALVFGSEASEIAGGEGPLRSSVKPGPLSP